jgi:hypothetical protein
MNTNRRSAQSEIAARSPAERSYSNVVSVSVTETSLVAMRVVPCRSSNVSVPPAPLALAEALGDTLAEALAEALADGLSEAEAEALADGESEADEEADGLTLAETLALGEIDALGEIESDTLADGTEDGGIPRWSDSDCAAVSCAHVVAPVVVPAHVPVVIPTPPPDPLVTVLSRCSVIEARFAFVTPETLVVSLASSENPMQWTIREAAVTVIPGVERLDVPVPWSAAVPTTMSVVTFATPWSATTSIAPRQWFPTPSTVTAPSEAPAILAKIVRVLHAGSTELPAANVCSKILSQPPGMFGVPAVVVESVDSKTMIIRSP